MISICIPSWNSLEYLKISIPSIKKNTKLPYEIIVHDNGSTDGTEEWLKKNNVKYSKSAKNEGFCGVNHALRAAKYEYCLMFNSDMYALPGWDFAILGQIMSFKKAKIKRFTISCNLIESSGNNPEYDIFNAGVNAESFDEKHLLDWFSSTQPKRADTKQWSHPILVPKFMLEEINYLDETYFPGWNVDNDMPKELFEKGCRNFCLLGNSRVYHFISKTFSKLPPEIKNKDGQDLFLKKWKLSTDNFRNEMKIKERFEMVKE